MLLWTLAILVVVIVILIVFLILLLNYIMDRMFQPTYPPVMRGELPDGDVTAHLLTAEKPWEVDLQLRVWEPGTFDGRSIVLFHGWESSMGHFSSYIQHYLGKNYRVIAVDLRSSGESEYEKFVTSYDYIDDINHTLRWIDDTYDDIHFQVIFGHSLGGVSLVVGLGLGIIDEDYLDVLIIEGIYGHASYLLDRVKEQGNWIKVLQPLIMYLMQSRLRQKTHPDHPLVDTIDNLELMHPRDHLSNISIPVLSLHAADDYVVAPSHQDILVSRAGIHVEVKRIVSGGHFKTSKQKGYFDILDDFIEKHR